MPVFPVYGMRNGRCLCPKGPDCQHPGKHPMTPRGFKDATTDETQIRAWSRSFPRANIATPTGGRYMVVDVDPRNGGDDALRELTLAYGELPETVLCLTGGGGAHYYFAASENAFPKELVGGIDLKGPGGYVTIRRECLDHMI